MEHQSNRETNEFEGQELNDNDELNFEKYDKHSVKPTKEQQEQDSLIFNQTIKSLGSISTSTTTATAIKTTSSTTTIITSTTPETTTTNQPKSDITYNDDNTMTREINSAISITTINKTKEPLDDISDDDDEYIKNKKKEIENIKPHFSSDDEMIKFNIGDLKLFIEKLEQSNIDLALEYQDDPDPIYLESIKENIDVIDKKKKVLEELENLLIKNEGLFL
ncbi:hypothetical protein RB653_001604 [Dictyostelium firmibasis]|uniref:Uncharacterized protein n=1 Tax=Dictyostelium firmibasis TaxID=79012 RepID=A0AAN7UGZ9_9MYCE